MKTFKENINIFFLIAFFLIVNIVVAAGYYNISGANCIASPSETSASIVCNYSINNPPLNSESRNVSVEYKMSGIDLATNSKFTDSPQKSTHVINTFGIFRGTLTNLVPNASYDVTVSLFDPKNSPQYSYFPTFSFKTINNNKQSNSSPQNAPSSYSSSFYFGGKVTASVLCTCNTDMSSKITIQGPGSSSGTYLYVPANKKYANYSVQSGKYLLGKYKSGGACKMLAYPKCTTETISKGTIDFTGTS